MSLYTKGEAGIGTLILFIAMIIVAAVAAMVYLQTSTSLQNKALATGSQTQTQISSGVMIVKAWGEDASFLGSIDRIYFTAKLIPGSDPLPLNESYVSFSKQDGRQTFRYNETGDCTNISAVQEAGAANTFLVTGLVAYTRPGFLLDGDVVTICIRHDVCMVRESTTISVSFVPKTGAISSFTTATPDVMTEGKVPLYPN